MADLIDQLNFGGVAWDIALPPDSKDTMFYPLSGGRVTYTGTIPGIDALYDGLAIHVYFPVQTNTNCTVNINSLGAKAIYLTVGGTRVSTNIPAACYATLVYNGANDYWVWERAYVDGNTNTIGYQLRTNSALWANKTGYTMNRYTLLFEVDGGLSGAATTIGTGTSKTTVSFKYIPGGVIKYYSTSGEIANNANFGATGLWDQYAIDLRYTFNIGSTLTSGKPVYMRCSINTDGTLTPNYTGSPSHPITQTLPTTNDGYVYVFLGQAYSTTSIELYNNHPIYYMGADGVIHLYGGQIINPNDYVQWGANSGHKLSIEYGSSTDAPLRLCNTISGGPALEIAGTSYAQYISFSAGTITNTGTINLKKPSDVGNATYNLVLPIDNATMVTAISLGSDACKANNYGYVDISTMAGTMTINNPWNTNTTLSLVNGSAGRCLTCYGGTNTAPRIEFANDANAGTTYKYTTTLQKNTSLSVNNTVYLPKTNGTLLTDQSVSTLTVHNILLKDTYLRCSFQIILPGSYLSSAITSISTLNYWLGTLGFGTDETNILPASGCYSSSSQAIYGIIKADNTTQVKIYYGFGNSVTISNATIYDRMQWMYMA